MKYIFENENALELYCTIAKDLNVKITPGETFRGDDSVYISESFMNDCLKDIVKINN